MQLLVWNHVHLQHTHLVSHILHAGIEEFYLITLTDATVGNLEIGNNTAEGVEYRVEDERLQRSVLVAYRMRNALNDSVEDILHTLARLT